MSITRRPALKHFLIVAGGISIIPSCLQENDNTSIPLNNLDLNGSHEKLLAEIEETIIPATDTPGAIELQTHIFTLIMLNDCYEKDKQQQFVKGLKEINSISKKKFGNPFIECTTPQREDILTSIQNKKGYSEDVSAFYGITKDLTIRGYMNSKYVMTNLVIYELVPGRFNGSYPVNKKNIKV